MIIHFILRLIFFYCLFVVIKAILKKFMVTQAPAQKSHHARTSQARPSDVFEAEYKVVNEEK